MVLKIRRSLNAEPVMHTRTIRENWAAELEEKRPDPFGLTKQQQEEEAAKAGRGHGNAPFCSAKRSNLTIICFLFNNIVNEIQNEIKLNSQKVGIFTACSNI